jgi:hypothetical protein
MFDMTGGPERADPIGRIDREELLADLRARGARSTIHVVEPQADGIGAAYITDLNDLVAARRALLNHPGITDVEDGPTGMAWTLLFRGPR